MDNKEAATGRLAHKKTNTTLLAVVIALIAICFIALQINQRFFSKNGVDKAATTDEQLVKVDDLLDAAAMPQVQPVRDVTKEDHILGSETAPVKVIAYSDFECPYCSAFDEVLMQAKQDFGDQVAIVFRHYPLVQLHAYAMTAALASECAAEQGKFWEAYAELFKANRENRLNADEIKSIAASLKLDTAKFDQCLSSEKFRDKVVAQFEEGKAASVSGTPTAFINGEIVTGANPYEDVTRNDGSKVEGLKNIIQRKLGGK